MKQIQKLVLMLCFLTPLLGCAEKFVELTADIEFNDWDYWLLEDRDASSSTTDNKTTIFPKSFTLHCVVGANTWMMDGGGFIKDAKTTCWFTVTNPVLHTVIKSNLGSEWNERLVIHLPVPCL